MAHRDPSLSWLIRVVLYFFPPRDVPVINVPQPKRPNRPKVIDGNTVSNVCLECRKRPIIEHDVCDQCFASVRGPLLLRAHRGHVSHEWVSGMFKDSWDGHGCPSVRRVYKIIQCGDVISAKSSTVDAVGGGDYHWHGTRRECHLGDLVEHLTPCNSSSCGLCSAIGKPSGITVADTQPGIYTSSESNKAAKWCKGPSKSPFNAVLLSKPTVKVIANETNPTIHDLRSTDRLGDAGANGGGVVWPDYLVLYDAQ